MIDPTSLAFDIDGVVADTMTLFLDILHHEYHLDGILYEDITRYNLAECLDIDLEIIDAVVKRILDGNYKSNLKPIEGAVEVLRRICLIHRPIVFVTARPYAGPIEEWLLKVLKVPPDAISAVATGTHEDKAEVLLRHSISHFVDDRLETCYLLKEDGITPLLFRQPWNREQHPFVEIKNWAELDAMIDFKRF
jgi:uncharacterized HAD superfamily protein